MTGFVLQFEPFLKALQKAVTGVTLGLHRPSLTPNPASYTEQGPAFADDFTVLTSNPEDLLKVDCMARRYEEQSGALLCRNRKSKVLFLGEWQNPTKRPGFPGQYLREVEEAKVFGFLPTLHQRSQVINTYLAATLWYTAQVIPLPTKYRKQINTEVSRFLFYGRITMGHLTLAELSHPVKQGGLGCVDIQKKADSLLLKEVCRMLERRGPGYRHISFWLGHSLRGSMTFNEGPRFCGRPPPLRKLCTCKV